MSKEEQAVLILEGEAPVPAELVNFVSRYRKLKAMVDRRFG
jgi:hypothetical protein